MADAGDGRAAPRRVVVIGAGVAGLAIAYELAVRSERSDPPIELACLDAAPRAGGAIRTSREEGFLCEWAASGFLDTTPATLDLARRLGLEPRLVEARGSARRRFVYRRGRLRSVPERPGELLGSDVLSLAGRLRALAEPAVPRRREAGDESVYAFARRRLGREATAVLVDALVGGIYSGDLARLSLAATFPALRQLETDHGSLLRGMLALRRRDRTGAGSRLRSFQEGMQELTDGLAAGLGPRLRLGEVVRAVIHRGPCDLRIVREPGPPLEAQAVVLACPAWQARLLLSELDPLLAQTLGTIVSASIAVVHLGWRAVDLPQQPEGFGFLVPRGQGLRILGALWPASVFEHRAPPGSVLGTVMIGGAHDPGAVDLDDRELVALARGDLRRALRWRADPEPVLSVVRRHARGIPQYELGHLDRLAEVERRLAGYPGLWIAGSSYRGVSVNACVEQAAGLAEGVLASLSS